MKTKNRLTPQQEQFCINIVNGMSQTKAYQNAYSADYNTAKSAGTRLIARDYISQRIEELRKPQYEQIECSMREREQFYADWIRTDIDKRKLSEDQKAKYAFDAAHRLAQLRHEYQDAAPNDNRTFNIIMLSENAELRKKLETIGQQFGGNDAVQRLGEGKGSCQIEETEAAREDVTP